MRKIKMSTLIKTTSGVTFDVRFIIENRLFYFMEFLEEQRFLCKSLLTKKVRAALKEACAKKTNFYFSKDEWKILQKLGVVDNE